MRMRFFAPVAGSTIIPRFNKWGRWSLLIGLVPRSEFMERR